MALLLTIQGRYVIMISNINRNSEVKTMYYLKTLYEVTAMLLLYSNQMNKNDYSTVISRYIYENKHYWESDTERKYIDAIGILLSLERNAVPISKEIFVFLEKTISSISEEYLLKHFSENDVSVMKSDIQAARSVINYYAKNVNSDLS